MSQLIVLSAIGTDRTGIVQDITKVVLACGGNIEESRMTTLGAEFATLMLVSGNWHTLDKLERGLEKLGKDDNLTVTIRKTDARPTKDDRMPYAVDVVSLDTPGIVFSLASFFASRQIEISDVATRRYAAAHTGAPMFAVQMAVNIPSAVNLAQLRDTSTRYSNPLRPKLAGEDFERTQDEPSRSRLCLRGHRRQDRAVEGPARQ
jgi:glycine cleavage system transcriptional repressor